MYFLIKLYIILFALSYITNALTLETPDYTNCTIDGYKTWITFDNNTCYYLSGSAERLSWHDANDACRPFNAQLISIHDQYLNQLLINASRINTYNYITSVKYWIGLNALSERGIYLWSDGSVYQYSQFPINPPENVPHLDATTFYTQGRCVYYNSLSVYQSSTKLNDFFGYWYYEDCNSELRYICAKSLNATVTPTSTSIPAGNCESDWIQYDDKKCIKYLNTSLTFASSQNRCQQLNGDIIAIHSLKEQSFVNALIAGLQSPYIGLQYHTAANKWFWSDQSSVNFANWGNRMQINGYGCAVIVTSEVQTGKWNYSSCDAFRPVICEKPKNTSLTKPPINPFPKCTLFTGLDNFTQFQNSCYFISDANKTWDEAEAECELIYSSHLVSIVSGFEYSFLMYHALQYSLIDSYWIGLFTKDTDADGVNKPQAFEWSDSWPVYYTYWDENEPRFNPQNTRRCVYQISNSWKTGDCDQNRRFICKKSNDKTMVVDSSFVGNCPKGNSVDPKQMWTDLDKRSKYCYWFSMDLPNSIGRETWFEAAYHCKQRNSTMVSIHSMHDMLILKNKITASKFNTWIGLNQSPEGEYVWDDGSAVDFTNWDTNIGERSQTTDSCVITRALDLKWQKTQCTGYSVADNNYICQIPKIYVSNQTTSSKPLFTSSTNSAINTKLSTLTTSPQTSQTIESKPVKTGSKKLTNAAKAGIVISVILVICAAIGGVIFAVIKFNINVPSLPSFGSIWTARKRTPTQN